MFKRIFITTMIVVVYATTYGQNRGTINGILKDSASKQILSLATVTVFSSKDTSIVSYRLSDPTGAFQVPGIPFNLLCRIVITFQGYKTYRKEFTLVKENARLDLGTVFLSPSFHELENVIIAAERPPIVVRNDTLEFNANSFKTLPTAVVEDLLKKLPGVEVDMDGGIKVHGKRVSRLLVDGREFFSGDYKIATRNLPANIVDKIQVTHDNEELESNPQMTKDEVGQVINIKLKRGIRQGWFGKAYAGAGSNKRNEAGIIVNMFRDTTQISIIGYSNNVNKPGFDTRDLSNLGGYNRGGGNNTLGGADQGIQQSRGAGFNFNHQFGKNLTFNLQYFYGQADNYNKQFGSTQRFYLDTTISTSNSSSNWTLNRNHRVAGSVIWQIDSFTKLTFRPNIILSNNNAHGFSNSAVSDNYNGDRNSNNGNSHSNGDGNNYSPSLSISKRFKKKGRFLNLTSDLSANNNANDYFTDFFYVFHTNSIRIDSLVNQLRATDRTNIRANININFTEPLGRTTSIIFQNQVTYLNEKNILDLFSIDTFTGSYDAFNDSLSYGIEKRGWKNTISSVLSISLKKLTIRPGIVLYSANLKNNFTRNPDVKQNFSYLYPTLNLKWKTFNLGYRATVNEPSASDLQEVIDISGLVTKSYGNSRLRPEQVHNLDLSYTNYSPKGRSLFVNITGRMHRNDVLRQTSIDSRGVQVSNLVNINGVRSISMTFNYNKQFTFNPNLTAYIGPSANLNYNRSYVSFNGVISKAQTHLISGSFGGTINYKDLINVTQFYYVYFNSASYEDQKRYKNINFISRTYRSEVILRWPKRITWDNVINCTYNPRVDAGVRKTIVQWNAGVGFHFLKQDKGQVKLSAYDLLNQNLQVYSYTFENGSGNRQLTTLRRYYLLSFIYNIRNFSGGKDSGRHRTFGLF